MVKARTRNTTSYSKVSLVLFSALILAYLLNGIYSPLSITSDNLDTLSPYMLRLLNISIVIPISIIWSLIFFSYMRVSKYSSSLKGQESKGFNQIAQGLMWLAFVMPARSVLTIAFQQIQHTGVRSSIATITVNYVGLLLAMLAFVYISKGAYLLAKTTKIKSSAINHHAYVYFFTLASSIYTYLVVVRPVDGTKVYYLPDLVIMCTLAVPYVYAWYRGAIGVRYLQEYRKHSVGVLYKKALHYLALGLGIQVFGSASIQMFLTLSNNISRLNITPLLTIIYVLLIVIGIGGIFIARGASQLQKIEEA